MKKKPARKTQLPMELSPPIQLTNIPEPSEDQIIEASIKLPAIIEESLNVARSKCAIRKGRKFRSESDREEVEAIEIKREDETRAAALDVVSILMTCLHRFADISDLYEIDLRNKPLTELSKMAMYNSLRMVGTSAHHAGVLFLKECLGYDFLNRYPDLMKNWPEIFQRIDHQILLARIDWERMRCFHITAKAKTEQNRWISRAKIIEVITEADRKRSSPHDSFTPSGLTKMMNGWSPKVPEPDAKTKTGAYLWKLKTIKPHLLKNLGGHPYYIQPEAWDQVAFQVEGN